MVFVWMVLCKASCTFKSVALLFCVFVSVTSLLRYLPGYLRGEYVALKMLVV